jgi:hypothetical protein
MLKPRWRLTPLEIAAVLLPFLVFAGVVAVWQAIFGYDPEKPLREGELATLSAFADSPPESLTLSFGSEDQVVTEPAEISEFLHLLLEPEVIPYHHSHPEDGLTFEFADQPLAYALGRDSQAPDEYWLELDGDPDSGLTLKLFRSEALTAWLIRRELIDE